MNAALAKGTELPPLVVAPITRTTLAAFAEASGDDNPIHLDPAAAAAAGHEDVIAHGMLSMAYLARLVSGWVPQEDIRSLRVRFVATTPVGAEVTCTGKVTGVEEVGGEQRAKVALTAKLADGTTTVRGDAVVAVSSSPPTF